MDVIPKLEQEWLDAIEGMTFFGDPIDDMPRERLLVLVGMLVTKNQRLEQRLRSTESEWIGRIYQAHPKESP